MLTEEKNRFEKQPENPVVITLLTNNITHLQAELKFLEQEIKKWIQNHKPLNEAYDILISTLGIGSVIVAQILAKLLELGKIGNKPIE